MAIVPIVPIVPIVSSDSAISIAAIIKNQFIKHFLVNLFPLHAQARMQAKDENFRKKT